MSWPKWLHRRCEQQRQDDHEKFTRWARKSKADWGAKNTQIKEAAEQQVKAAYELARERMAQAQKRADKFDKLIAALTETPRGENCMKVRLSDREHAEAMAAHVLETAGVRTEPYQCPVCPRQLFERGRFWHVRTVDDPTERAKRDAAKNGKTRGRPDRLALRLSPEQRALMNARARGSSVDGSGVEQSGSSTGS